MQKTKQKGSVLFIIIVIIGLILVTQYNLKSIFESKQFKDNMAYIQTIPSQLFKFFVVDPTVSAIKDQANGIGINQKTIDDLNKGKLPSSTLNTKIFDGVSPGLMMDPTVPSRK